MAAEGKVVSGKGYFGTQSITEVTKFAFRTGTSKIIGNVTYMGEPRGSLYLFMDTNWQEKFHNEEDCDKVKHAHTRIPIGKVGNVAKGIGVATGKEPVHDDASNMNTWEFEWTITHAVRTYGWYFTIADCTGFENGDPKSEMDIKMEESLADSSKSNKRKRKRRLRRNLFKYNIELYNPDGDHLPADEYGQFTIYSLTFLPMLAFFIHSQSTYSKKMGNGFFVGSHAVIKTFAFAYVFQLISMLLEMLHLYAYSGNGYGVFIFDFFSEFMEGLSQLIISFTLLCLANGWTLVDLSRRPASSMSMWLKQTMNQPQLDDETPMLFVLLIIIFITTVLQIISKVQDDSFHKFHDHDGIAGWFLYLQRISLGIAFTSSILGTVRSEDVRGQMQLEGFLYRLMMFGAIWFFAFPVLVSITPLFAHYLRHRVVTIGVLVIQSICLTMMASQFLSSSSWYAKVSEVASSGMLPGAFGGMRKGSKVY